MKGIKLLDNGTYVVQYCERHPISRIPKTLRRKTNAVGLPIKSRAEAERVYRELVLDVKEALNRQLVPTWSKMIEEYLLFARSLNHSEKTIEDYRLCLNAHTKERWGNLSVNEVTTGMVRSLILTDLSEKSEGHKKNVLKQIRAVFNLALDQNHINRNPTPQLKFKFGDKIRSVLKQSEAALLIAKAKEFDSEWFWTWSVALYTGMRSGELYALTWDKVDFSRGVIKVDSSWSNKTGYKSTKSGDDRLVPISPELREILIELKQCNQDSLFVLPRNPKWDKGEQARELRHFLMSIGLPQVRFHDLRASWATILLNHGVVPAKVMSMGGWKDMKTMMIYMRKAGIQVMGATDSISLKAPTFGPFQGSKYEGCSNLSYSLDQEQGISIG